MRPHWVIKNYVKNVYGSSDDEAIKKALIAMYVDQKLDPGEIVRKIFNVMKTRITAYSIRYWLKKSGIPLRSKRNRTSLFDKQLARLGYGSVKDFFIKHQNKTFIEMADILSISSSTIKSKYNKFVQE